MIIGHSDEDNNPIISQKLLKDFMKEMAVGDFRSVKMFIQELDQRLIYTPYGREDLANRTEINLIIKKDLTKYI